LRCDPLHVVQQVIDNAADEALAGFGKRIALTLHADGPVSVDDDDRGIPFGLHPGEQVPVVEIVFKRLHVGDKFDKGAGGAPMASAVVFSSRRRSGSAAWSSVPTAGWHVMRAA
jgi:hypothetical protein